MGGVERVRAWHLLRPLVCATLAVAACAPASDSPGASPTATSALAAPLFPLAPAIVRDRAPLPFCGVEVGHPPEGFNVPARQCFWTAVSTGRQAELVSSQPTGGGKPITTIWRSLGGGRVEFFVDFTRSGIPGFGWTRTTCPRLTLTSDPNVAPDWIPGIVGAPAGGCTEQPLAVP